MDSITHTPGPWTKRGGGHSIGDPATNHPDMMDWCSSVDCFAPFTENEYGDFERVEQQTVGSGYGKTLAEAQANARLIAAAPDLLAACKAALRNEGDADDLLAAAIAKAEG